MATLVELLTWQPKVGLQKMTDTELYEYCLQRQTDVTANTAFDAVTPTSADVLTTIEAFKTALDAQRPGDKLSTEAKNMKRLLLEKIMNSYCDGCYIIAGGNKTVFLTTGFGIRNKPTQTTSVSAPSGFTVMSTAAGQLIIKSRIAPRGKGYQVFVGTTADNLQLYAALTGRRLFINGLTPGQLYFVAMKTIGPKGLVSDMSTVVSQRCL